MKKLMIMAVVASLGIAAQARSWVFSVDGAIKTGYDTTTPNGNLGAGYDVYVIAADKDNLTALDSTRANLISMDAFLTKIRNGQSFSAAAGTALLATTTTTDDSKFLTDAISIADDNVSYYYDGAPFANMLYAFYAIDGGDYVFISNALGVTVDNDSPSIALMSYCTNVLRDDTGKGSFTERGWYAMGVPEPTSGLLMLLGMAGLALKRRRA